MPYFLRVGRTISTAHADNSPIVSTAKKVVYCLNSIKRQTMKLLSKQKEKGFQETANFSKSLEIPYFKPISVLFYLFRDSRHTVSTWLERTE